jgi:sortase A
VSARKVSLQTNVGRSLFAAAFIGYVVSVAWILHAALDQPTPVTNSTVHATSTSTHISKKTTTPLPVRLKIPVINVDTSIVPTGLTRAGAMAIPKDPDTVAWYELGPRPGEVGSAVIAGHYGWENGRGSVFNKLHTLQKGDKISIATKKGDSVSFIVRKKMIYEPEADATAVFKSQDGKAHLNIITCNGIWNAAKQTYTDRLILFTDMQS